MDYCSYPGAELHGEVVLPGDKSITQRAILLAMIASGESSIYPFTPAEDILSTLSACRELGLEVELSAEKIILQGQNRKLSAPKKALDLGNSGTGCRLLAGILAAQAFNSTLTGDASLRMRPMQRIITPLTQMGAVITANDERCPLHIEGNRKLRALTHRLELASAQVKACLLFAALFSPGQSKIFTKPSRDHSERLLQQIGYPIAVYDDHICLEGMAPIKGGQFQIPGDFSAAAFFILAATLKKNSKILLKNVGINPKRIAFLNVLKAMGAQITLSNQQLYGLEPVADIYVESANLKGINVSATAVSAMLDEFPCLAIAAALSEGVTCFRQAQELRVKESDRIHAMTQGLRDLGIEVKEFNDGVEIVGGHLQGGVVDSFDDHRIAMAFAIAGNVAKTPIRIKNCGKVATSFPNFIATAGQLGMQLETIEEVA